MINKYFDERLYLLDKKFISEELEKKEFKLSFKKELEEKFKQYYFTRIKRLMKYTIILGILIYLIFGALDLLTYKEYLLDLYLIRYVLGGIPVISLGLSVLKAKRETTIQILFTLSLFAAGLSIIAMMFKVNDPSNRYYAGLTVVLLFSYIATGLRFKYTLLIGWGLIVIYLISSLFFMKVNPIFQINNIFFLIFFNIIGMISSYWFEKHQRNLFLLSNLIVIERKELEKINRKLKDLSIKDPLTKIANRRYFNEFFSREWKRALRHNQPISVIMLDIDYFKKYNDSLGHQKGDKVLLKIAHVLNNFTRRAGDLAARYGGEEFVIVLSGTNLENALQITKKIKNKIKGLNIEHPDSDVSNYLTVSFGVATTIPNKDKRCEKLLLHADKCMYLAKEKGRNRIEYKIFKD